MPAGQSPLSDEKARDPAVMHWPRIPGTFFYTACGQLTYCVRPAQI